jgi:hypothetical protein
MGTTAYFDKDVTDAATDKPLRLEVGTSGFAGNGPQLYLNLGESSVLLSHEDAKAFCEAVTKVEGYFGYLK